MLYPELAILQALIYASFLLIRGHVPQDQSVLGRFANLPQKFIKHPLHDSHAPNTANVATSTHQMARDSDSEKQFEDPSKRAFPWALHLLFAVTTSSPLIVTVLAYKQRLALRYMAADYVGNLGLDHRNAWISIGGIVAASGSAAIFVLQKLLPQRETFLQAPIPNLEHRSLTPDTILYKAAFCSVIHHVLLAATNHVTPLSYVRYIGNAPLLVVLCIGALIYWRRPKWRSVCKTAVNYLAILLVATTAGTQLFSDIRELMDVSEARVQPYNYRWKVKDWTPR
ncbi:hypothetical protein MMC11_001221 [Xylographa trunciseda]|nr:hypothetical protein [Xylographa trunciseda]